VEKREEAQIGLKRKESLFQSVCCVQAGKDNKNFIFYARREQNIPQQNVPHGVTACHSHSLCCLQKSTIKTVYWAGLTLFPAINTGRGKHPGKAQAY
jgi:hypothetical protein